MHQPQIWHPATRMFQGQSAHNQPPPWRFAFHFVARDEEADIATAGSQENALFPCTAPKRSTQSQDRQESRWQQGNLGSRLSRVLTAWWFLKTVGKVRSSHGDNFFFFDDQSQKRNTLKNSRHRSPHACSLQIRGCEGWFSWEGKLLLLCPPSSKILCSTDSPRQMHFHC